MKATLEYNLPDEESEYNIARRGINFYCAISEFSNFLGRRYKHTDFPNEGASKEFREIREKWNEILEEEKADIDE